MELTLRVRSLLLKPILFKFSVFFILPLPEIFVSKDNYYGNFLASLFFV
jgi:hypothetical protein